VSSQSEFERLRVVLVSPRNPLNIGAVARAMTNFGFERLRVVNPYNIAFREARSAVGASAVLAAAEEFPSVAETIADCSLVVGTTAIGPRELHHPVKLLPEGAGVIRERLTAGPVGLLFGSEKRGLSNEDLSHCHWLLRIPTEADHRSMNLGQAVAVCLYELARFDAVQSPEPSSEPPAGAAQIERLVGVLLEALQESTYTTPDRATTTEEKLRRMLLRFSANAADAEVLLGMMRKILWKLKHGDGASPG
jgi:tRNA/rRNA methyltransferase